MREPLKLTVLLFCCCTCTFITKANGHTGLERKPFADVCNTLQELPRPLSLVFVHKGLKLTMQRTSGMVDR